METHLLSLMKIYVQQHRKCAVDARQGHLSDTPNPATFPRCLSSGRAIASFLPPFSSAVHMTYALYLHLAPFTSVVACPHGDCHPSERGLEGPRRLRCNTCKTIYVYLSPVFVRKKKHVFCSSLCAAVSTVWDWPMRLAFTSARLSRCYVYILVWYAECSLPGYPGWSTVPCGLSSRGGISGVWLDTQVRPPARPYSSRRHQVKLRYKNSIILACFDVCLVEEGEKLTIAATASFET